MLRLDILFHSRSAVRQIALFLAIIASTIAFATTTVSSRIFVDIFRIGASTLFILLVTLLIFTQLKEKRIVLYSIFLLLCLFGYGMLQIFIRGTPHDDAESLVLNFLVTFALTYIFSIRTGREEDHLLAVSIILYAFSILILTFIIGGIKFEPIPHFIFEYVNINIEGKSEVEYTQGATKFYGLAAICSSYLMVNTNSFYIKSFSLFSLALFIILTVMGGARGEAIFAILIVFYIIIKVSRKFFWFFLFITTVTIIYLSNIIDFKQFVLIERMLNIINSSGDRIGILWDSFNLLISRLDCLIIGCGPYYFQDYYGYSLGLYPHNFVIEFIIIYGILITIFIFILFIRGMYLVLYNKIQMGLFSPLIIYFFLISLKSGSVISSWFVMAGLLYFAAVGMASFGQSNANYMQLNTKRD